MQSNNGHSLYARSLLFVILGGGALFGAIFVLSSWIVADAEQRLLEERSGLARTAGRFLEERIRGQLRHLVDLARPYLESGDGSERAREWFTGVETTPGVFAEGFFVFDAKGKLVASVPDGPADMRQALDDAIDVRELMSRSPARSGIATSGLVFIGPKPVVVVVAPVIGKDQEPIGYVGGLLHPVANDLLDPLRHGRDTQDAEVGLVDASGTVVASTDRRQLFHNADHEGILARAMVERREFRGRCHNCHSPKRQQQKKPPREIDVLAFSPLPTLDLGLTVVQPEARALAPALALRRHLWGSGVSLIALFVFFTMLAVRSVVRPITLLTRAVRRAEERNEPLPERSYGADEVGELASALDSSRRRMLESLTVAEAHREKLRAETDAVRRHLDALRDISDLSTARAEMGALAERTLDRALELSGLPSGVLRLKHRSGVIVSRRGMSEVEAGELIDRLPSERPSSRTASQPPNEPVDGRIAFADLGAARASKRFGTALAGRLHGAQGLEVVLVVACERPGEKVEQIWLGSLIQHLSLCVSHLLLRDADRDRQQQQEQYLHRVLQAQEDERSRVARDLHDTVAQDLAALRLEIERLCRHASDDALREQLEKLEKRASEMLDTVRRILLDLRLSVLESMGFIGALRWQLDRTGQEHGLRTSLMVDGDENKEVGYERAVGLFRIFQEALLNIVQHAGAQQVFATIKLGDDTLDLTVEDDGDGFDPESLTGPKLDGRARGLGILGMEERARLLGGTLDVSSSPGEGTTIRATVPARPAASRAQV